MGLRAISLFSGIAGLDKGVKLACPGVRTVCYVENNEFCQRVLRARMQDGSIDDGPIWDDVTTFDGTEWRGRADLITAGYPCQPWSVAGKRRGKADDRWLWPAVARIIGEVRPRYAFLENVDDHITWDGLGSVLADLAALGFSAEWATVSACAIGAPHTRERLFCLAYASRKRREECHAAAEPGRTRLGYRDADADGADWQSRPRPLGVADGVSDRSQRISALGNAVVPAQAAVAFSLLWERMMETTGQGVGGELVARLGGEER